MVIQGMMAASVGLGCIALVSGGGGYSHAQVIPNASFEPLQSLRRAIQWLDTQEEWSRKTRMWGLYAGATGLAITSATVVNCLTSLASLVCDMGSDHSSVLSSSSTASSPSAKKIQPIGKGLALGRFRSWGQLGRAAGPIAACSLYWRVGPLICYGTASLAVAAVCILASKVLPEVRKLPIRTRVQKPSADAAAAKKDL